MKKRIFLLSVLITLGTAGGASSLLRTPSRAAKPEIPSPAWISAESNDSFRYTFKKEGILLASSSMIESPSRFWWLSSGGALILKNGKGMTLHGEQEKNSRLQKRSALFNSEHSDGGFHPQNIFRLVTRNAWKNFSQEIYVKIDRINLSDSLDRDASDGILLFNRYQDQETLYYAGVRVDGSAVIKKKNQGTYSTLDQRPFFETNGQIYDRIKNPNFLPTQRWVGLRSVVQTLEDGRVRLQLFMDRSAVGIWELAAEATDDGSVGGPAIQDAGYAGLRLDYLDATMDNYFIQEK
ncbi:MAG TPA: hypothetical protein VJB99_03385 [Patescibacteria group bacterium]|nr:hypothetical protein [Patescibacteria group bacterium]